MNKRLSRLFVRIVDKSIQKEANSACLCFGYQPPVPEAINRFKRKKKQ